jgi:hypothetical protein
VELAEDMGEVALDLAQFRVRQGTARDEAKEIKQEERENGRREGVEDRDVLALLAPKTTTPTPTKPPTPPRQPRRDGELPKHSSGKARQQPTGPWCHYRSSGTT